MTEVRTRLTIAAPPARVWAVLTDFAAYPRWNQIISRVRADPRPGGKLGFRIKLEGTPELAFTAKFVRFDPGHALRWRGGAPLVPSLAWGEHYFELSPAEDGRTLLVHGEQFGGLLALLIRGAAHARVTRTYERFNQALKARAESGE